MADNVTLPYGPPIRTINRDADSQHRQVFAVDGGGAADSAAEKIWTMGTAVTSASMPVNIAADQVVPVSEGHTVCSGPTTAVANALVIAGYYNSSAPTPTAGQATALQLTSAGCLKADLATIQGSATFSNYGSSPGAVTAVPVNAFVTNSLALAVSASSTGLSKIRYVSVSSAPAAQVLKASAGRLYHALLTNTAAYTVFAKLYNIAAASVTVGTSAIAYTIAVPAGQSIPIPFGPASIGTYFNNTGWSFAITKLAADSDTTAVAAGDLICQFELG